MLRVQSESGWWLITHPDHARLAAEFASHWGNEIFMQPHPRAQVLDGIKVHDDGWAERDAHPAITREGKPSAFSHELVGKYSAFEDIDLADYLAVRERAVEAVESRSPYAALLVSIHTYNLLTERADRSTIAQEQLPLLDSFLTRQLARQERLCLTVREDAHFSLTEVSDATILANFRLLQATDNLSLLSCVGHTQTATLLHALPTLDGASSTIDVLPAAPRSFRLVPYPLDQPSLTFEIPARHVAGETFAAADELACKFNAAPLETLTIKITA